MRYLWLVFSFLIGAAHAATYYVDATAGNDANSGASAAPYKTIQKGVDKAVAGDTVIVKNGVYTASGDRVVQLNNGGTAAAPITLRAENKWQAIIDGQNYRTTFGIVPMQGASYYTIDGFQIRYTSVAGLWPFGNGTTFLHDLTIKNLWVHHIGRVMVSNCADGGGRVGAFSNGFTHHIIWADNLWHDIGRIPNPACDANLGTTPNYRHDHALYLQGKYHTVVRNVFYNMFAGYAIKVDGFFGPLTNASDASHVIINNTFAFPSNPKEVSGHIRFFSNGVDGGAREQQGSYTMIYATNVQLTNNISYQPPDHSGTPGAATAGPTFAAALYDGVMYYTGTVARNNLTTAPSIIDEAYGGSAISSKVTFSGNKVSTDPKFVNAAANDFHLAAGSPAIGTGVGGVDLGAFPYSGSPPPPPPPPPPPLPPPPPPGDTTPPTVTITGVTSSVQTVAGMVTITATATDDVGVVRVDFYAGTSLIGSATSPPYKVTVDSRGAANGVVTLSAKAYDAAGNTKTSANVLVTVAN